MLRALERFCFSDDWLNLVSSTNRPECDMENPGESLVGECSVDDEYGNMRCTSLTCCVTELVKKARHAVVCAVRDAICPTIDSFTIDAIEYVTEYGPSTCPFAPPSPV